MSKTHASHDWSPISWTCVECAASILSIDAQYQCRPSTDDARPSDSEPAEIDYAAITRSLSG